MKNIYLVRHGRSEANDNKTILRSKPDHAISLSEEGKEQAIKAGQWLKEHLTNQYNYRLGDSLYDNKPLPKIRMWVSPYKRTRQTAHEMLTALGGARDSSPTYPVAGTDQKPAWCDVREHMLLVEQQFGLFDGIPDDELWKQYPEEHEHYKRCEDFKGRFWARMPLGESRFDVAQRVHQAFGTFHRDEERHGIDNLIIVSHGVTIRAFVMMWCHKPFEWFEEEPNAHNCAIRLIEGQQDCGRIFDGFER